MYLTREICCRLFPLLSTAVLLLTSCTKSNNVLTDAIEVPEGFTVEVAAGPEFCRAGSPAARTSSVSETLVEFLGQTGSTTDRNGNKGSGPRAWRGGFKSVY